MGIRDSWNSVQAALERVVNQADVEVLRAGAMERRPVEVSEGMWKMTNDEFRRTNE